MSITSLLGKRKTSNESDPDAPRNPNPCHIEPFTSDRDGGGMPEISPGGVSPLRKKETEDSPRPQKLHDPNDERFAKISEYIPYNDGSDETPVEIEIQISHPSAIVLQQHEHAMADKAAKADRDYLGLVVRIVAADKAGDGVDAVLPDETISVCLSAEKTAADLQGDIDACRQRATLLHLGNTLQLREPQYAKFDQFDPPATPWQN